MSNGNLRVPLSDEYSPDDIEDFADDELDEEDEE